MSEICDLRVERDPDGSAQARIAIDRRKAILLSMADCEVEQAYPVEPDVVDLSDSINDVSIREQALEPQQAAMNDVKGEPIKSGNKDGPPKGGDGVVHVGSSGGGASIGCEEEVPWENRLCEAADRDGETLLTVGPLPAAEMGQCSAARAGRGDGAVRPR